MNHKKTSTNTTLLEYTASYDATSKRLSSVVEGPTSATTSYTFDSSGRLLTENRTGGSPYASTYTYNSRGLRATGFRSESSTTSHDGTYTYDNAGRLTTVTQPSLATENYTWNADGTLASLPGSGYTRNLSYDEEGRVIELKQGTTSKFTFGYGYDGGRRWTKDLANSVWSWFPCGVACSAGELTELTSDLTGTTWTTASTSLTRPGCGGGGLPLRIGAQVPLPGLFGQTAAVTDSTATVVATAVFDAFGVQRFGTGTLSAGVLRATYGNGNEDGMTAFLAGRGLDPNGYQKRIPWLWIACGAICAVGALYLWDAFQRCWNKRCGQYQFPDNFRCQVNCVIEKVGLNGAFILGACLLCLCLALGKLEVCEKLMKVIRGK